MMWQELPKQVLQKLKKNKFTNTFNFSNHGINKINKFTLLLWRRVYPYEYINDWKIQWNIIAREIGFL